MRNKTSSKSSLLPIAAALASVLVAVPAPASAAGGQANGKEAASSSPYARSDEQRQQDARTYIANATDAVKLMQKDPGMRALLAKAQGVFLVPRFGQAGVIIGGRGGEGLLMAHHVNTWTGPVFYKYGGITVGATIGAEAGALALVLMNDKALNSFMRSNRFSLTADAGLTVSTYNPSAGAQAGHGDAVLWMNTKGAYANLSVGVNDVLFDPEQNRALYRMEIKPADVVDGNVGSSLAEPLHRQLNSVDRGKAGT